MKSLIETIQEDHLKARKEQNKVETALLATVLGDISNGVREDVNDKKVFDVIKRFYKDITMTIKILEKRNDDIDSLNKMKLEKEVLLKYMPKQLEDDELESLIAVHVMENGYSGMKDMRHVMKFLQESFEGQYDGESASSITKRLLS